MTGPYRAFSKEFVHHMHGAWPAGKIVRPWFSQHGNGLGSSTYSDLRNGQAQRVIYSRMLIECIRDTDPATKDQVQDARDRLYDFLSKSGFTTPETLTPEQIAAHVCDPPVARRPPPIASERHWLTAGLKAIPRIFNFKGAVEKRISRCRNESDVVEAVHWIFIDVGRSISRTDEIVSIDQAIADAEEHMDISEDDYAARALLWSEFHPWTVVRAKAEHTPTAVSIILPLSERAYARVRAGEVRSYDCTTADFELPSRFLLVEAAQPRPADLSGAPIGKGSRALLTTMLAQGAVLSRFSELAQHEVLHLLSFAGTPTARKALIAHRYVPTGTQMPGSGVEYYERLLPRHPRRNADILFALVAEHLSRELYAAPPD